MRKSLWSPDEDAKLKKYVMQFGHGNWSDVAKYAGLQRCGKSCRLRWLNYLRPDLKRGKFSSDEIRLIVKLHRTLGNSWSRIASCLPGRTDNDIKNFWHSYTRSTRRVILSSSGGTPDDPPSDVSNNLVAASRQHLSDYFSTNVNSQASHGQDLYCSDDAALQNACSYKYGFYHLLGTFHAAHHPSLSQCSEQQQQQAEGGGQSSPFSLASGSSSTPSPPSAVSAQDSNSIASARDAAPPSLLSSHHDPSSRRCSAEDSVMEVAMASLPQINHQHDPDPDLDLDLLSRSAAWDQINEEIIDDGLHSVLVNFISHQPLASQYYRFT